MDKEIAEYIARAVKTIDPEISIVAALRNVIIVPFLSTPIGFFGQWSDIPRVAGMLRQERISLEHKIPGGLLGFGERSRTLAIKWDE